MPLPASLRSLLRPTLLLGLAGLGVVGCGGGSSASAAGGTSASTLQAPANLTATPGDGQVLLSWAPSAGAVGYHVQRTTTSGGPYSLIGSPTIATYADTGVSNGTTYFYVVSAIYSSGESPASAQVSATPSAAPPGRLTVVLDPTAPHPISPYIYGLNFATQVMGAPPQLTLDRAGGNRWTAYNWETNASNAGSDYLYENDAYLSSSSTPGEAVRHVIAGDQALGMASLVTFQLQGLVAGDENGPVSTANPPDMTRFKQVVPKKSTVSSLPFTATPPTTDDAVFMDEFLWALDQAFPGQSIFGASPTHPTFVELDNEPELWNSTHLETQGSRPVTSDAYLAKTLALARALKGLFPNVVLFGPVHYGFGGIYNWQGELSATPNGANWFPDKYLPALKAASDAYGRPLVDVYDFHWYSEATDGSGHRVISLTGPNLTDAQVQAIVQSPRSLWDPTYTEASWITTDVLGAPINLLGRLKAKIAAENPGMKLAITEYHNGGSQHMAGTIAEADNLGIFGSQGLFAATFWPLNKDESYPLAGFRAYRDFDGSGASFGDISIPATSSDVSKAALYASLDSTTPGRLVLVAINRSIQAQSVAISGASFSGTAHLYQMTAASAQGQSPIHPVAIGTQPASGTTLTLVLPALSVTTVDIR